MQMIFMVMTQNFTGERARKRVSAFLEEQKEEMETEMEKSRGQGTDPVKQCK